MGEKRPQRRDRCDTSGNPEADYVDEAKTVLVNKLGITQLDRLQLLEEEKLAQAYETLSGQIRSDTPLTCELIKHIHNLIFGDIYEWAGRWRTVWIRKPGMTWPAPDFIDESMTAFEEDVLQKRRAARIGDDDDFCRAAALIQGEFLTIHPFREGNARTIKLATDIVASQTGRPLLAYDQSVEGRQQYVRAARQAFGKNYDGLTRVIRDALERART
jgi:cell filamentation protein